ncbi:hypothetical protein BGZ79_006845 [Entomortierella chlamydospora]|nr:hypothetical protein BGZ79_006845 [Entomortierella chlamydospora]
MTKSEATAAEAARRSNRAKTTTTETKPTTSTVAATTKTESEASTAGEVVKRKPGRPPGSGNKSLVKNPEPKTPGRRGRPRTVNIDQKEKVVTTPGKRGRKRKLDVDGSTPSKKPTTDDSDAPRKRGRPAGTGKKQVAAAKQAAKESTAVAAAVAAAKAIEGKGDDDTGAFNGIKLTIERCTTCTQYHKNVVRIFKVIKELYPLALTHEEVVPNSKSFEIYLSNNGSRNKLIWSGKAHAPPKRLAFPDSDVFVKLLKDELKDE